MEVSSPGPSTLRTIRVLVLGTTAALAAVFVVLVLVGPAFADVDTVWLALPVILGLADLVLVPAVGSTVRPLPHGVGPADARRIAEGVLRTVTYLRLALATAPAAFGLVASVAAGSLVPYAVGVVFAVPLLLGYALPRERIVAAVRQRLESGGTPSHLGDPLRR